MIKEQGELLQKEFCELSTEHGIKGSFGYFIDKFGQAMVSFNNVNDNDIMFMMSQLVVRVANRNEATPDEILKALGDGIKDMFPAEKSAPEN